MEMSKGINEFIKNVVMTKIDEVTMVEVIEVG